MKKGPMAKLFTILLRFLPALIAALNDSKTVTAIAGLLSRWGVKRPKAYLTILVAVLTIVATVYGVSYG